MHLSFPCRLCSTNEPIFICLFAVVINKICALKACQASRPSCRGCGTTRRTQGIIFEQIHTRARGAPYTDQAIPYLGKALECSSQVLCFSIQRPNSSIQNRPFTGNRPASAHLPGSLFFHKRIKQVKNNGLKASIAGDEKNRAISVVAFPFRIESYGIRNPLLRV